MENNTVLNYSFSCDTPTVHQEEGWNRSASGGRRERQEESTQGAKEPKE